MSSLTVEVQEPRGKSVKVSDEGLTVDLVDGRLWRLWLGSRAFGMGRRRSATISKSSETAPTSIGPIWTRT
jgi:hypothetical protein